MESVNEVKVIKFRMIVEETHRWLCSTLMGQTALLPFYLLIINKDKIEKYLGNVYFKSIYDICFFREENLEKTGPNSMELKKVIQILKKNENYACPTRGLFELPSLDFPCNKIRGGLIFWSLVLAAIDEEFYENELNIIADLACMLEFNEDMVADWIKAVKYLLDGNMFNENRDIDFKTDEAKLFFRHKGRFLSQLKEELCND